MTPESSPFQSAPPPRALAVVAAGLFAVHAALGARYGIFRDELYYLACGEHLAWGYVDHPPLVALVARLSREAFGHWLPGLRLAPALCAPATALLAAAIARAMGGGRFAQLVAALAVAIAPAYLVVDGFLSMNCFEPVVWASGALLCTRAVVDGHRRAWFAFGLVCGLGLLAKHSTLFFGAAIAVGLLATPHRRVLGTREAWAAVGIAAVMFGPNVAWEVHHGWPTLEFMRNARLEKMIRFGPLAFAREQVVSMHPANAIVWGTGLAWLLVGDRGRPWRFLGVGWVALFALFVTTGAKPYYLAPYYPILFGAGGAALEQGVVAAAARRAFAVGLVTLGAAIAPMALPILPPVAYERWSSTIGLKASNDERYATGILPQWFADQFGWEPMVVKVGAAYAGLTPEEQRVTAIYASNYGEAGAVDWFGPRFGLPGAVSGHNSYFLWGPPAAGRGAVLIAIGARLPLEQAYEDVRKVDETDAPLAMPFENHRAIYVCRGLKRPLPELWPASRIYL